MGKRKKREEPLIDAARREKGSCEECREKEKREIKCKGMKA